MAPYEDKHHRACEQVRQSVKRDQAAKSEIRKRQRDERIKWRGGRRDWRVWNTPRPGTWIERQEFIARRQTCRVGNRDTPLPECDYVDQIVSVVDRKHRANNDGADQDSETRQAKPK